MDRFLYIELLFRLFDLGIIGQDCVIRKFVMLAVDTETYMLTSADFLSLLFFSLIQLNYFQLSSLISLWQPKL